VGHKQTPRRQLGRGRFTPQSGHRELASLGPFSANRRHHAHLFNYLVGAQQERFGDRQAERFGGREIDDKLEFRRLLDWNIARLRPAQDLIDVICRAPEQIQVAWSVGHETPVRTKSRVLKTVGSRTPTANVWMRVKLATMS
jgi:hypothetical protein